jgi:hypothetical protein
MTRLILAAALSATFACWCGMNFASPPTSRTTRPATHPEATATTRPAAAKPKHLEITATIDGSDELHIAANGFEWRHKHWDWPGDVKVNGRAWDPQAEKLALDDEAVGLTPDDLKAERVTVLNRTGRDTVAVEAAEDGLVIYFADSLAGSDVYSVTLEFAAAR